MSMMSLRIQEELDKEKDVADFFYCWIHYESTLFYLWETMYMFAFWYNIFFTLVAISFQYLLLINMQRGIWYFAQIVFLLDIIYNIVVQQVNNRGVLTRFIKDSVMVYASKYFILDLIGFASIVITFSGDFFSMW